MEIVGIHERSDLRGRVAVFKDRELYFAHPIIQIYGAKLRNSRMAP